MGLKFNFDPQKENADDSGEGAEVAKCPEWEDRVSLTHAPPPAHPMLTEHQGHGGPQEGTQQGCSSVRRQHKDARNCVTRTP